MILAVAEPGTISYQVLFGLMIALAGVKLILSLVLLRKVREKRDDPAALANSFITNVFFLIFCLFIARIFFIVFDFHYTQLDPNVYHETPDVWFWKVGSFVSSIGALPLLAYLDKKLLKNKMHYVPVILLLIGAIVVLVYPVEKKSDFNLISLIAILSGLGVLIIPIIFLNLGRKTTGQIKRVSYMLGFGLIVYGIGGALINEGLLGPAKQSFGENISIFIFLLSTIMKIVGLTMVTFASSKFKL